MLKIKTTNRYRNLNPLRVRLQAYPSRLQFEKHKIHTGVHSFTPQIIQPTTKAPDSVTDGHWDFN